MILFLFLSGRVLVPADNSAIINTLRSWTDNKDPQRDVNYPYLLSEWIRTGKVFPLNETGVENLLALENSSNKKKKVVQELRSTSKCPTYVQVMLDG